MGDPRMGASKTELCSLMVPRGQKSKVKELDRLDSFLELQNRILLFSWFLVLLSGL